MNRKSFCNPIILFFWSFVKVQHIRLMSSVTSSVVKEKESGRHVRTGVKKDPIWRCPVFSTLDEMFEIEIFRLNRKFEEKLKIDKKLMQNNASEFWISFATIWNVYSWCVKSRCADQEPSASQKAKLNWTKLLRVTYTVQCPCVSN